MWHAIDGLGRLLMIMMISIISMFHFILMRAYSEAIELEVFTYRSPGTSACISSKVLRGLKIICIGNYEGSFTLRGYFAHPKIHTNCE
jgi:hypothetical protein